MFTETRKFSVGMRGWHRRQRGNGMTKTKRLSTEALKLASLFERALLETLITQFLTARQTRRTQSAIHSRQSETFSGETAGGPGGFGRSTLPHNNSTWLPHGLPASDCWVFVAEINDIHNDVLSLWIKARDYKDPPLPWRRARTRHSKVKGNEEERLGKGDAAHMRVIKRPCRPTKRCRAN